MARPKRQPEDGDLIDPSQPAGRKPWKRIKVTRYKIFTSVGKVIQHQFVELPAEEAERFVAEGHAVAA